MKIIADMHLHSKYSRAVSQEMTLENMAMWARKKGIGLLATGDWTHPLWLREIKANLEEVASGLYGLKSSVILRERSESKDPLRDSSASGLRMTNNPLFILSTEISSIYSQNGKGHRIHIVILAPSIEVVEKINKSLVNHGANLMSDGRPITGIPAPELVKIVLNVEEKCLIIPAHVWTPWFSLYGSESGFDSINDCFGNMAEYIYGVETGLSSDPAMNWRIGELDKRTIISSSDAHSGPKLGREATVFEMEEASFENIRKAIMRLSVPSFQFSDKSLSVVGQSVNETDKQKTDKPETENGQPKTDNRIAYTLEFYPEEGKYHYTGHRDCHIRQSPEETKKLGESCPVCGKHLTIGVMHRVEQLAHNTQLLTLDTKIDKNGVKWIGYQNKPPYAMLVPLQEILAEAIGGLPTSLNIKNEYENLVAKLGSEFSILLETPLEQIAKMSRPKVAEGIGKVRAGNIIVEPGYDGVFGVVKIWSEKDDQDKEEEENKEQMALF
ncbi:MAG: endonuclease Q family protein [Candidatus Gottesmanbacteria bacterium]